MGITGIKDLLVNNLRETIKDLQDRDIYQIICSGDIKNTSKNIGKNCGILSDFIIDITLDDPSIDLNEQLDLILQCEENQQPGLLIGRRELSMILKIDQLSQKLIKVIRKSKGLVVYTAEPSVKGDLTRFLKRYGFITMCVGDGANDIDMIRESHIGMGIKNGENLHAADNADVGINSVTDIPLLIDISDRICYLNSYLVLFFNYLKMSVILYLFVYDFNNGFTGKSLFNELMLLSFNLFLGWNILTYVITNTNINKNLNENKNRIYGRSKSNIFYFYFNIDCYDYKLFYFGKTFTLYSYTVYCVFMISINIKIIRRFTDKLTNIITIIIVFLFYLITYLPISNQIPNGFIICIGVNNLLLSWINKNRK